MEKSTRLSFQRMTMDSHIESAYLRELGDECEFALLSLQEMNRAFKERNRTVRFFRCAQDFLQHSGAISRIFWPPPSAGARAKARGAHLKQALGVTDCHPLEKRSLRNHLEHFDERIDDWAESSVNRTIADRIIVPRRQIMSTITETDIFRMFESDTRHYIFRGEEFDMQALYDGVQDIQRRVRQRVGDLQRAKP
jgi:hypothetical protein